MDDEQALRALSALSNPIRLGAMLRLLEAGPAGLTNGAVAAAVGLGPNVVSPHLLILSAAGLVRSTRSGRQVTYRVDTGPAALLADWLRRRLPHRG